MKLPIECRLLVAVLLTLSGLLEAAPEVKEGREKPTATVLIFTTTDCPVANAMVPEITRISKDFAEKGVAFQLVYIDPDTTPAKVREHAMEYRIMIPQVLDPDHKLVKRYKAERTPEAFVVRRDGGVAYHGRINNLYHAPGQRRRAPTTHELRDALSAVLSGEKIANPHVPAIGCVIADFAK
jgi:thiol-disulfide isomerase/thioredoxin